MAPKKTAAAAEKNTRGSAEPEATKEKVAGKSAIHGLDLIVRELTDTVEQAVKKVGVFDENIFLYTEDIDLTRRMHQYYRTVFYPHANVYHLHERGSYKNLALLVCHIKSAITYFNKWGWFNDPERDKINRTTLLKLAQ